MKDLTIKNIKIEKQLAVFLDNRPGALARLCEALATESVNVSALSVIDTLDYAVVRMVVDKADKAEQVLSKMVSVVQVRDVLTLDLPNEAGAIAWIAERLASAGINIEYSYCTSLDTQSVGMLVLRTNDLESTINVLS